MRRRTKMGVAKLVLGSAILGLFWSNYVNGSLTNSVNRCDAPPCSCDDYGRLTCDCKDEGEELILTTEGQRRLSPHTSRIVVGNCSSVSLTSSSLTSMTGLRSLDFVNVGNLSLQRQSFELSTRSSRVRISIKNCSVDLFPSFAFRGDVEAISFENVRIGQMSSFAFANLLGTESLRLESCYVESMEAQAFKKFDVGYLHVVGGSFGDSVPSRAMNDLEVKHKFMLDGVEMGTVRSSAFIIKRPRTVAIQNCVLGTVESEAFVITARGPVIVKNNTFGNLNVGAFLAIRADPESRPPAASAAGLHDVIFKNNSLSNFEAGSVMFDRSSFRPELDNVLIDQPCDCSLLPVWKGNVLNYSTVYAKFHPTGVPREPIGEGPETFLCVNGYDVDAPITFVDFESRYCAATGSVLVFVLVLVGLLLVLLIGAFLVVWCCRKQRDNGQKMWISVPTSAPDVVSKKNGVIDRDRPAGQVDSRITMVVPDGRLYRETEFHVIVEKTEPLTTEL